MSVVCMETFNKNRFYIAMAEFLPTEHIFSPATANNREPIIRSEGGREGARERWRDEGSEEGSKE